MSDTEQTMVEQLKTVYTDPILLMTMLFGFVLMVVAGTLLGMVFILIFSTFYIMWHDKF